MDGVTLTGLIREILGQLGVERFSAVGTSVGGNLSFRLASENSEMVDRLVLINTPSEPVAIPRSARPGGVRRQMWLSDDLLKFRIRSFWKTYYSYLWGNPKRLSEALIEEYYDMNRRRLEGHLPDNLIPRNPPPEQVSQMLGSLQLPVLVIWGMKDPVLPPSTLESLVGKLTNAPKTIAELSDVGHYPMSEAPDEVMPPVVEFLSK